MPLIAPPKQPSKWQTRLEASAKAKTCPADMETTPTYDVLGEALISVSTGAHRAILPLLVCNTIECSNNNNSSNIANTTNNNNTAIAHLCSEIHRHSTVISPPTPTPSHQHLSFPPSNRPNSSACPVPLPLPRSRASRKAASLSCETHLRHHIATQARLRKPPLAAGDRWLKAQQARPPLIRP